MLARLWNLFKFRVERLFLRGAHYRLLVIALAIGLVSIVAGGIVHRAGSDFGSAGEAYWWAFLRLTDPGYLGDDVGTLRRVVSTVVTILGYVLFLGALIAIMTQWLNQTIDKLEAGQTPVAHNGHVVIVGFSNRTATIVREMLESGTRLKNFLRLHGARRLQLVVLAEEKASVITQELRDRLGKIWNERQITVRTGSPLRREHLQRADFANAAVIVMPGRDFAQDGALQSDARVIKTLLAVGNFVRGSDRALPLLVAEIFDARKERLARRAYDGDVEIVASRALVARLMAQCIRHPGLSEVHSEMLTRSGSARVFVRERPEIAGRRYAEVVKTYEHALVLGVVRPEGSDFKPMIHPPATLKLEADDRLVFLAPDREATEPDRALAPPKGAPATLETEPEPPSETAATRRVLVLGYCHKLGALLEDLSLHTTGSYDVVVASRLAVKERLAKLAHVPTSERVRVEHVDADFTLPSEIAVLKPDTFDVVLVVASDWWGTSEAADARSIVGCMVLADVLAQAQQRPKVIVELFDPENVPLVRNLADDVIVSPLILSYQLAQIALRRELGAVFDELFGPGGAQIVARSGASYGLGESARFGEILTAARAQGELAIGTRTPHDDGTSTLQLVPGRDQEVQLGRSTEILVLRHDRASQRVISELRRP